MNPLSSFPNQPNNNLQGSKITQYASLATHLFKKKQMSDRDSISPFQFIPEKFGKKMKPFKVVKQIENLYKNETLTKFDDIKRVIDHNSKQSVVDNLMEEHGLIWKHFYSQNKNESTKSTPMLMTNTNESITFSFPSNLPAKSNLKKEVTKAINRTPAMSTKSTRTRSMSFLDDSNGKYDKMNNSTSSF